MRPDRSPPACSGRPRKSRDAGASIWAHAHNPRGGTDPDLERRDLVEHLGRAGRPKCPQSDGLRRAWILDCEAARVDEVALVVEQTAGGDEDVHDRSVL